MYNPVDPCLFDRWRSFVFRSSTQAGKTRYILKQKLLHGERKRAKRVNKESKREEVNGNERGQVLPGERFYRIQGSGLQTGRYLGCSLRFLPSLALKGSYAFKGAISRSVVHAGVP